MIESIYKTLTALGYTHPLHPTLTHLTIGMVMGAFLFVVLALIFNRESLARTARHCSVLALVAAVPTALLGLMDWQHFYGGSLLLPIEMKIFLAAVLIVLLFIAVIFGFFGERFSRFLVLLYLLCMLTVIGLGYFGGELVYGTRETAAGVNEGMAAEGALVFKQNCSACHLTDSTAAKIGPGLMGIFKADKFPVSGWQVSEENFRKQLQEPFDKMPPFGHLPPDQVEALIAYLKTL
jgi:cytochrome c2